jgi:transcriptional regulator with XRE-family HTH domain
MNIAQKILIEILELKNIKINRLAKKLGVSTTGLYNIRDGEVLKISGELAYKLITAFPDLNINYLITGDGDKLKMDANEMEINKINDDADTSSMTAIIKLIENYKILAVAAKQQSEANVIQARANEKQSEANITQARSNEKLVQTNGQLTEMVRVNSGN